MLHAVVSDRIAFFDDVRQLVYAKVVLVRAGGPDSLLLLNPQIFLVCLLITGGEHAAPRELFLLGNLLQICSFALPDLVLFHQNVL